MIAGGEDVIKYTVRLHNGALINLPPEVCHALEFAHTSFKTTAEVWVPSPEQVKGVHVFNFETWTFSRHDTPSVCIGMFRRKRERKAVSASSATTSPPETMTVFRMQSGAPRRPFQVIPGAPMNVFTNVNPVRVPRTPAASQAQGIRTVIRGGTSGPVGSTAFHMKDTAFYNQLPTKKQHWATTTGNKRRRLQTSGTVAPPNPLQLLAQAASLPRKYIKARESLKMPVPSPQTRVHTEKQASATVKTEPMSQGQQIVPPPPPLEHEEDAGCNRFVFR